MDFFDIQNEAVRFAFAFLAGIALGAAYFSGLWLTVRGLLRTRRPVLLLLVSFIGRMALVLIGFYFVMNREWQQLLACLLGLLLARTLIVRRVRPERPIPLKSKITKMH